MILTTRARVLLLLAAGVVLLGLVEMLAFLIHIGTATIFWIGLEWALFRYRIDGFHRHVSVRRVLRDKQGEARILWSGRLAHVSTQVRCRPCLRFLPATLVTIHDLLPAGTIQKNGSTGDRFVFGGASSTFCLLYTSPSPRD